VRTILLIEDNADSAKIVTRALKPHGYQVLHAFDGESGLLMAMEEEPDLILLDMGLPDIDGQTLAGLIKSIPELAQVPLVAVTAWPLETVEQITRAYGCDGCISKPLSPRELPSQVAAYLNSRDDR
jgi:two-component system cell cycle response regulator DivK